MRRVATLGFMLTQIDRDFGAVIQKLIRKENLTRKEAGEAVHRIPNNKKEKKI